MLLEIYDNSFGDDGSGICVKPSRFIRNTF